MKKILFILISVAILGSYLYAQDANHMEIIFYGNYKKGHQVDPEETPKTRSIVSQSVYAYLYNKNLFISFDKDIQTAIINIINGSTGETIYTYEYISPSRVFINLSSKDLGTYDIEIITQDIYLWGNFIL